jgi:hypothetical protein
MEDELEIIRVIVRMAVCEKCIYKEKCDKANECLCYRALDRIRDTLKNK